MTAKMLPIALGATRRGVRSLANVMTRHHSLRAGLIGAALLMLTACGSRENADEAASNFVPPVTQPPDPIPGQANATPLTAYIGHYPRDAVDGVSFFDRSDVANALAEIVDDQQLRRLITGRDATQVPIFRLGSRIAVHGCEAHDCGGHNWTVLIASDGDQGKAALCHHDASAMGETSRWSTRAGVSTRPGGCPTA